MKSSLLRLAAAVASLAAAALLVACNDAPTDPKEDAPQVSYAADYVETVGIAVSIEPVLSGGPATRFRINPRLPDGLALDTATGRIHGTPEEADAEEDYRVIAVGPGGADTMTFSLEVLPAVTHSTVSLSLSLKATTGYTLSRLIVEYVSSVSSDLVIRDTLLPGMNGFSATSSANQTLLKAYSLKPGRDWKIRVRAFDANDSLMYRDSAQVLDLSVAENWPVTMSLEPRFLRFVAKFNLPDSMRASGTRQPQILNIRRLYLALNGSTVADSSRAYFAPGAVHTLMIPYVRAEGSQIFEAKVYADISGWPVDKPVFGNTVTISPAADTTNIPSLPWIGPGSPADPNYNPSNPGGAKSSATFSLSAFSQVNIEPGIPPGPLFKKK